MYAEVLVEYNSKHLDKTFTYLIPGKMKNSIKKGMKVLVPFGNRKIYGFIVNIKDDFEDIKNIKEIDSIAFEELVLSDELLALGVFMSQRTLCTKISAYQTMLPSALKIKNQKHNYQKYDVYILLSKNNDVITNYIDTYPKRKAQINILKELLKEKKVLKNNFSLGAVNVLLDLELVKEEKVLTYRLRNRNVLENVKRDLTEDQKRVINGIDFTKYSTNLIHGVTGSGKTEVYMNLIEKVISSGKEAILLVPEISLTIQTVNSFYSRFGDNVAIFHSSLSDGEKYDEYLKIVRGNVKIVVGTRSAIFTPFKNLGIIIIDEEHSETYKQDNMPRYNAINMANFRAKYNGIPLVLGSATPSLESMSKAKIGIYNYFSMPNRINDAVLPKCYIVNMYNEMKHKRTILSELLSKKIKERLANKEQVIILLNRRGFSSVITCQSCGYTFKCPHCDISLTYHKINNQLRCHYCGYTIFKPSLCPDCKEESLNNLGLGTERLEEVLKETFKESRVIRLDADTTTKRGSHEKIILDFQNHEYDILVGTQMVSKGLDFPLVTLVGVINADASLNIPDFRSSERTYSLLSQVAGRAGRKTSNGEVVFQTFNDDNMVFKCLKDNDYNAFFEYEMKNRKILKYSPYYFLTSIKIASKDYELSSKEAIKCRDFLEKKLNNEDIILGPTTASMFKINNIYRFQIIIKYKEEKHVLKVLHELDDMCLRNQKVNLEIDIHPVKI